MTALDPERRVRLLYAFGHLVGSFAVGDPHAADSGALADEVLIETGFSDTEREVIEALAEEVARWEDDRLAGPGGAP